MIISSGSPGRADSMLQYVEMGRSVYACDDDRLFQCVSTSGQLVCNKNFTSLAYALGLGTRFGLHMFPHSQGLLIVEYIFVVLSVSPPYKI